MVKIKQEQNILDETERVVFSDALFLFSKTEKVAFKEVKIGIREVFDGKMKMSAIKINKGCSEEIVGFEMKNAVHFSSQTKNKKQDIKLFYKLYKNQLREKTKCQEDYQVLVGTNSLDSG